MKWLNYCGCVLLLAGMAFPVHAVREGVAKQVDLPHNYYWREMYLPQLTSGPSWLAFYPDNQTLLYSMAGSLWRQALNSTEAVEITHPVAAYDYQPDINKDGKTAVFSRYNGQSMELWSVDLMTGKSAALTENGAFNVEPRFSPDGKQVLWVSSLGQGHFNLHVADYSATGLSHIRQLIPETKSAIDRYYYSTSNHSINPSWSSDGREIYFVMNAENAWGSGDVYAMSVSNPSVVRKVIVEETTWAARPELSPDGKRLLYSSYRGRQWHQLWLTTPNSESPLPLTFGEFDRRNARWSPDGKKIGFISNEHGNTELIVQTMVGGAQKSIVAASRKTLVPMGTITIQIRKETGEQTPARVKVQASDQRTYAPLLSWMHADDGFDRERQKTESQYFHCLNTCTLAMPAGKANIVVQYGLAHQLWQKNITVVPGEKQVVDVNLQANALPAIYGPWRSADLHVHMNYGGHYRNHPENLVQQAKAEDLNIVHNLIVNKEERIPDVAYFQALADKASDSETVIWHGQEFHTSFWGHLGLLNLDDHLLLPDFASYRHTAMASPYPHNGVIADLAHQQLALVGYVHPFDWVIVPEKEAKLSHLLPADAINSKVDYLEVVGFSDHLATAEVWYKLLNLNLKLAAGSGTDAMANYASLRGPVGMNRVFINRDSMDKSRVNQDIRSGHSFVTNSALLGLRVNGMAPGDVLNGKAGQTITVEVSMRSIAAMEKLELVQNGVVVKAFDLKNHAKNFDANVQLAVNHDGWLLLRASNSQAQPEILDIYPYATTNPIWLNGFGEKPDAKVDAAYFVRWLNRVLEATEKKRSDFNTHEEYKLTVNYIQQAINQYVELSK
ncbi:MAG: CehA/McbA family metallohydrolase [Arenimonas sp.]|nr:CehA/McbA family metallohydrolase [Arenimonas sp.]